MRTLVFEPDDKRYERIYGWMVSGQPLRDRGQARIHASVCDKLEAIGQQRLPVDEKGDPRPYKPDELRFYVTVTGGAVVLEEAEYEMVQQRTEAAISTIHPSLTRDYERALAFLESVVKEDAKPTPAVS